METRSRGHTRLRVIVGCEISGRVRDAFRRRGHDAWSCDLLPTLGDPKYHIQKDVLDVLQNGWDLGIFFPPCTFLNSAGLHWNKRRPGRAEKTEEALAFVKQLLDAPIEKIALENPVGCISTRIRPPDQIIQPYQFGEDASKQTCLWLKNLSLLRPTKYIQPRLVCQECGGVNSYKAKFETGCQDCGAECDKLKPRWANQTDSGQNRLGPSEERAMIRGLTYRGIAEAMAEQWSTDAAAESVARKET